MKAKMVLFAFEHTPLQKTEATSCLNFMYAFFIPRLGIAYGWWQGSFYARETELGGKTIVLAKMVANMTEVNEAQRTISLGRRIAQAVRQKQAKPTIIRRAYSSHQRA